MSEYSEEGELSPEQRLLVRLIVEKIEGALEGIRSDLQEIRDGIETNFKEISNAVETTFQSLSDQSQALRSITADCDRMVAETTWNTAECRRVIAVIDRKLLELSLPVSWRNQSHRCYSERLPSRGPFAQ